MTLPNDSLRRSWVEIAAVNPDLVANFRPSLLCFVAVAPGRHYQIVGTGFVIAANNDFALAMTAKHVLVEGAERIQRPTPSHASSALFVHPTQPSLDPQKLRAVWMGQQHADMLNVLHAGYNDTTDLACCVVMPQESFVEPFRATSIPLDMAVPRTGDVVHLISQAALLVEEAVPPTDPSGRGQTIRFTKSVSIRIGTVTGVYPQGLRQYKWPCFTTSIPVEPGMSGGFTFLPRDGQTIAASGIVCADASPDEARTNQMLPGESIIACAWPALGLRFPDAIPSTPEGVTHSLYAMVRSGRVDVAVGGLDGIQFVEQDNGDCTIARREA